jgi:hypothetical protein
VSGIFLLLMLLELVHFIFPSGPEGSRREGKYVFTSVPILTAESENFSEEEIITILTEHRKFYLLYLYNNDKSFLYFKDLKEDYL